MVFAYDHVMHRTVSERFGAGLRKLACIKFRDSRTDKQIFYVCEPSDRPFVPIDVESFLSLILGGGPLI